MSDALTLLWREQEAHAEFPQPKELTMKLTKFERRVRVRNIIEYAAGTLGALVFGGAFIAALSAGELVFASAFALTLAGVFFVMWNLHRRASALVRKPEADCREHLRAQLVRQRDALRSVPSWYIAPLIPGVVGVYLATAWGVAGVSDVATALRGIAFPLGGTLVFFGFVCWLNLFSARNIDRQIEQLDAA